MTKNKNIKEIFVTFLLNTVVVFFIAVTYLKYVEKSDYLLANIYFVLASISHFIFLYLPVLLLTYLVYLITKKQRLTKIVFAVLSSFFIIILKLDAVIFSQFRYHISPFVLKLVFGKKAGDIFQFSTETVVTAITIVLLIVLLQFLFLYIAKKVVAKNINLRVKLLSLVFLFALIVSQFLYAWADASYYRPITQMAQVYPLYSPLTARTLLTEKLGIVDNEKVRKNRELYKITSSKAINYPLSKIKSNQLKTKKNILFLCIDSWRYDCLDSLITPNIYKISKKSQQFNNHYSGSNSTLGGVFSMFYGISALYWNQFTQLEKSPVLIEELNKQNYELDILASANLQNPPLDKNVFSAVKDLRLSSASEEPVGRDLEITNEWLNIVKERDKETPPFFSFVFFDAAHGSFYPEDYEIHFKPYKVIEFIKLNDKEDPIPIFNDYKNSLHFVDYQVGLILKQLEEKQLLEDTIIIITGDHGQEFNDNKKGYWQHGGNYSKYQLKVPMLIYDASREAKQYNELSLHYDLAPTLMNSYLGVTTPITDYSIGQNLYNLTPRDWFVAGYNNNYAIIEKDRITKVFPTGLYEITDLELNNLMDAELHYEVIKKSLAEINKFYAK